ncbi:hypothetical protein ACQR1I_16280 [Bradyrhizobium sp. HKCCYLS2038]|uniref:hypothetical protein n=1 Tax=unclassified Bradyrhizobium TaxID=2631580 RepID=UPI003EB9D213
MSPTLQSVVIPLAVLSIVCASFHSCATMARKRVSTWKSGATFWFWRTVSLTGLERRAKTIWMDRLGYDEADALVIADYQSLAYFLAGFGGWSVLVAAWYFFGQH